MLLLTRNAMQTGQFPSSLNFQQCQYPTNLKMNQLKNGSVIQCMLPADYQHLHKLQNNPYQVEYKSQIITLLSN